MQPRCELDIWTLFLPFLPRVAAARVARRHVPQVCAGDPVLLEIQSVVGTVVVFVQNGSFQAFGLWFPFQSRVPVSFCTSRSLTQLGQGLIFGTAALTYHRNSIAQLQWSAVISRIYFSSLIVHLLWKEVQLVFCSLGNKDAAFIFVMRWPQATGNRGKKIKAGIHFLRHQTLNCAVQKIL